MRYTREEYANMQAVQRRVARAEADYARFRAAYLEIAQTQPDHEVALAMIGADMNRAHAAKTPARNCEDSAQTAAVKGSRYARPTTLPLPSPSRSTTTTTSTSTSTSRTVRVWERAIALEE